VKKIIVAIYFLITIFSTTDLKAQSWGELNNKVILFYNQGDYQEAVQYAEKALQQAEVEFGKTHQNYGTSLNNLALLYESMGDYSKALPLYLEALENTEKSLGKEHSSYGVRLNNLAGLYRTMGDYSKALPLYLEALENTEKSLGKEHSWYGVYLSGLASLYNSMGDYSKALPLCLQALENTEKSLGKEHSEYGVRLNNLAELYQTMGDYSKALPLYLEALENTEKSLGKEHSSYGVYLSGLAFLYNSMGDYSKALPLYLEALENTEKSLGKEHSWYGVYLNNLAELYRTMGDYSKALPLYLEALENTEKSLGKEHSSYGVYLNNLAELYESMGEYPKALLLYLEALENTEKSLGKEHSSYGVRLNNLAGLYRTMGDYSKALPLYLEALENTEKSLGKEHSWYGVYLSGLASLYNSMGDYSKALPLYLEALENTEKSLGKEHSEYGVRLNNLAELYRTMGDYSKALPLYLEALENTEKSLGKEHPNYGVRLNNLAGLYRRMGDYPKALPLYLEALENTEKSLGKEHPNYGVRLNNLAVLYRTMGDYPKALPLYLETLENTEKSLGKEHSEYGVRLNNLAELYRTMGDYSKALPLYLEAIENISKQLEQAFSFMSESQKEQFLKTVDFNFEVYQSFFTRYSTEKPEVAQHAYDIELATKGMILQSGIQTRQAIQNSGDSTALQKFDEWSLYKNLLAKQYSLPIAERRSDLKELEDKAEKAEGELSRLSAAFGESKALSGIRWQDVQKQLGNNEVAIEFTSFNYRNNKEWTDSTLYIALVLRKDDKHPHLIPLFEQQQLDSLLASKGSSDAEFVSNLYQNYNGLYELVWQPLEQYVPKGSTVYFASSGSLHQIAMHAISLPDGSVLSDAYNLHQLSTTAMLTRQVEKTNTLPQHIALFGGIRYDATSTSPQTPTNEDFLTQKLSFSLPKDLVRGSESWTYLPGTLKEVEKIAAIAGQQKIKYTLHTGKDAEEEKFKQLSGKQAPEVLHIATHGFFFPDPKKELPDNLMRLDNEKQVYKQSDNPLYRSGLLFAGANKAWLGEEQTEGEDGILSAYEVSFQYFGNTKLVVLSACETGLGDIKGSEGVFGLQRAFKAAGVQYLMMSLWKVPDAATSEFMESFYTEWFKGNTIEQAFQNTQNQMKTKYRNEPYKWAAFVLVR
jgi:tetratricopeptide (TPR) repeat protein